MHQLLNIRKVQLLLLAMLSMQCSLHGMLSADNKDVVWNVIIANGLLQNDYAMHRECALVNTKFNKVVEDTYRPKKKLIQRFIQGKSNDVTGDRSWNRDFSKCAWITIIDSNSDKKHLKLTLTGLAHDDASRVISSSRLWQDFYFPVFEDDMRPFFNKDERASFYGCARAIGYGDYVVQYSLDLDGKSEKYRCFYAIPDRSCGGNTLENIMRLLNFPILMKAILQSKNKEIRSHYFCHDGYYLRWVTLPEDYKTYKKHVGLEKTQENLGICEYGKYGSYDCLPDNLREEFDHKYAWNQREKRTRNKYA